MPFFAERGYDCHAISFRGQVHCISCSSMMTMQNQALILNEVESPMSTPQVNTSCLPVLPQGNSRVADGSPPGTLASNAADAASYIAALPVAPIVVSHSFGGLVLQK